MPRSHPGVRGRGGKGRKEGGAEYPLGPPASAPRALHPCKGPLVPRPGHPLQGAAGPAGTQPTHTRGRRDTSCREPRASDHSPQRTEPSSRTTTRGHISAPAAGSPQPPQASRAGAAADTERTRRHLLSQTGPAAQAAWPGARARSRPRGPRTRTRLVSAPPRWLLTPRPPDSQLLVPAPACSLAVARAALPGHAPRPQAASSHVNVHTPPPTPHPLEAECVFSRSPGTSLDLSLSAVPFYVPGDPLSYLNWSSPAFTPSLTLQEPPPQALLRGATSKPTSLWSPQWLASPFIHRPSARWDLRGSTLLTPLHFPQSSAACSGSAHHVGASQRFPRLQRARRDHA